MVHKHAWQMDQTNRFQLTFKSCYDFPEQIPAASVILHSYHTTGKEVLHALRILNLFEKYKHAVKWVHNIDMQFNFLTQTPNRAKLEI